jgi:hypothetical protein
VNSYQFEKIFSRMQKEYGSIKKGQENRYDMFLYTLESNALKVHRANPACTSRMMQRGIALTLFDLQEEISGRKSDVNDFRSEPAAAFEHALRMAFDPLINEEVALQIEPLVTQQEKKQYYKLYIQCMLRINDSIELWDKHYGSNGYFKYIESTIGNLVGKDQMNYSIPASR